MMEFLRSIPGWIIIVLALPGICVIGEWLSDGMWGNADRDEED